MLAMIALPSFGQNRHDQRSVPRPQAQKQEKQQPERREAPREERRQDRRPERREVRPEFRPAPQPPRGPAPDQREYRTYQPPAQGHHSGQWLNQHREQPLDQQRRALENDPAFRRLPRERQQEYEQRLQRFNSLPPDRQKQVLRRMETWEHLTPQQKQDFSGIRSNFNSLPPDRRRAVRNAIDTLRAMPPDARQRELNSGRFSQFSPQEQQILHGAARLPLAPAEQSPQEEPQGNSSGQGRYVPRPPH